MIRWFYGLCIVVSVFSLLYLFFGGKTSGYAFIASTDKISTSVTFNSDHTHGQHTQVQKDRVSRKGYVMATHYSDQMTGSVANLMSLQCWANTLGPNIRVVEPFLRRSLLGVNLNAIEKSEVDKDDNNSVRLSDLVDMTKWENIINLSPLTNWEYFIEDAPRKLISVYKKVRGCDETDSVKATMFHHSTAVLAKQYGLEVVRNISLPCHLSQANEFKQFIYGKYTPHEVVVIFSLWGGVIENAKGDDFRIKISGSNVSQCQRSNYFHNIGPSPTIIRDAIKYTNKYIPSGSYISVMVRLEHLIIRHKLIDVSDKLVHSVISQCFKTLLSHVKLLKSLYSVDSIFLTMDCRKSGAEQFSNRGSQLYKSIATSAMDILFPMLYGNSITLEEWDKSFEDVASYNTPGYIAMLQKHLAAKGVCLLTVGGGMFQMKARQLHSTYHPNGPKCAQQVPTC